MSRRYVDYEPEYWVPDDWRAKAEDKKQGSSEEEYVNWLSRSERTSSRVQKACELAVHTYKTMLEAGVCPEQARMVLPQSMYTEYYVTGSLAAWARAYKQRIDDHAQKEIQDLAEQWGSIIQPLFPESWEALTRETDA